MGFSEPLNTEVFTTRYVVEDRCSITLVIHDLDDGAWEFYSNHEIKYFSNVSLIVSLREVLEIDPTLKEIGHLPQGYFATRETVDSEWRFHKQDWESII